jgi:tetratricopeptide (TPR) repeat protein
MAHVLNNIGSSYAHLGDKVKAIEYCNRAFIMQKKVFANKNNGDHADIVETLENLSAVYSSKSSVENERKSLEYAREAYEMQVRLFPNVNHPRTARLLLSMAQNYFNLANTFRENIDEYQTKAIMKKQEALLMQQVLYIGRNHVDIGNTLQSLGKSFQKKSDLNQALVFYEEAYKMRKSLHKNMPHEDLIESLESLQLIFWLKKDRNKSEEFRVMAKKMRKEIKMMK